MNTEAMEIRVSGRVQGVGFRYYTRYAAQDMGLTGWVRNESDGSVLVHAEGTAKQLQELADFFSRSTYTRIDAVDVRHCPPHGSYDTFQVQY